MKTKCGWRRLVTALVLCATSAVIVGIAVPSATADPSSKVSKVKTAPVQQLSNRVEKLIKEVEDNPALACSTRNSMVRRLRVLDDALRSGRRSAAQALATAWGHHAWSMESARVLAPKLGSSVQTELFGMVDQIGLGWPDKPGPTRHWKPLPSCGSTSDSVESASSEVSDPPVVGSYTPYAANDVSSDIEIFVTSLLQEVPVVGNMMAGLTQLLWPQGADADVNNLQLMVEQATYDSVSVELKGIGEALAGSGSSMNPEPGSWNGHVTAWRTFCEANGGFDSYPCYYQARETLWNLWDSMNTNIFIDQRAAFQQDNAEISQLDLLPLFAQYQNLYLTFLRDGMLLHKYWDENTDMDPKWSNLDNNIAAISMALQLDSANKAYGIGYVDDVYQMGFDEQPTDDWRTRNEYIRNMTLSVLDVRNTWKFLDPSAYPDGVPGGVKLTRMIYTYPTAHMQATPQLPYNVTGPLTETSIWTKYVDAGTGSYRAISSVQATNAPLLGPVQSGAVQGDTAQPANDAKYYNLRALGPIVEVKTQSDVSGCIGKQDKIPAYIGFYWAAGGHSDNGSYTNYHYGPYDFQFDSEVLATVQVISHYNVGNCGGTVADSVVLGFRYADSFNPAGDLIGVASEKCIRLAQFAPGTQAEIYYCNQPPGPDQIWTYDSGLQQISVTNPAEFSYADPTNSGKYCLDTEDGSTDPGTPVVINACDDGAVTYDDNDDPIVSSQRWTIDAVNDGIAKITNVKSGLVIAVSNHSTAAGARLLLEAYDGYQAQQWKAHSPLTGEIHGIGSGRCVDVPNYSTTPGTQVQIYDCKGNWAQQWTYDPTSKELVYAYAPSLCLDAENGGTTVGAAVVINYCNGEASQQWTLNGDGRTISNDKSGLVLDVPNGITANNTLLQLNTSNGTQGQQWSRTSTQGGALHSVAAGKCLGLPDWAAGIQATIASCASPLRAEQTWTYHPIAQTFTVNSPDGPKCLDAADGGTTAGTAVVINDCNGEASQQWSREFSNLGSPTVINVNSGLLLDLTGGQTTDGTTVELTPQPVDSQGALLPATSSQRWVWSLN